MNISLPADLGAAIAQMLEGVSRKELAVRAEALSASYRSGGTSAALSDSTGILAYLVARLPATYASVRAALEAVSETFPDFAPASLIDAGAGPGGASWAALETWPDLASITMLDHNRPLIDVARSLAAASANTALLEARFAEGDLASIVEQPNVDLVIASYVLAELPEDHAATIARILWSRADRMLVVVEPGTPAGFARIRAVREALLGEGAHVAAPCTHDNPCPMRAPDWCHFSQRLPRSRDQMLAKDAQVPFEDERYSYIALSREPPAPGNRARIIAAPVEDKAGITFPLCDDHGLHKGTILRRDRAVFNLMRKAGWGDVIVSED